MAATAISRSDAARRRGKKREKIFPAKILCNPLISLDSDERIQGNPRESKAHNRAVCPRKGREPRNPKCIGWTDAEAGRRENRKPISLEMQRALVVGAGSLGRLH